MQILKDISTFALKYEGLDLAVLKRLFTAIGPTPLVELVKSKPTGTYARRLWFLYEWLTGVRLDLPNADSGAYPLIVDPNQQYGVFAETSSRHRVKNNLPGTPDFCPLVFRTQALVDFIAADLRSSALEAIGAVPQDLLARTAAFLLLKDSKSSFAIEEERPAQNRIQRWARAIGRGGTAIDRPRRTPAFTTYCDRRHSLCKIWAYGLKGSFVGQYDYPPRMPVPDHISARPDDLAQLMEGLAAFDREYAQQLDPILAASVLAFGFVYIHPFDDGNGRLHRYLIHHVLAQRGFNPPGLVVPVSAVILDRINDYRKTLENYSKRLLPLVQWEPTEHGNVRVLNDTGDFYRFFDATPQTEFLYSCMQRTIELDLPQEGRFSQTLRCFSE